MGVPKRHLDRGMSHQLLDLAQRGTTLGEAGSEVVTTVVNAKVDDPYPLARGLKWLPHVAQAPDLAGTFMTEHPRGIGIILPEPLQDVGRPLCHGYSSRLRGLSIGRRE